MTSAGAYSNLHYLGNHGAFSQNPKAAFPRVALSFKTAPRATAPSEPSLALSSAGGSRITNHRMQLVPSESTCPVPDFMSSKIQNDLLFVVAGEPSGDRHAASVISALKQTRPSTSVVGFGGSHLKQAGMEVLIDLPSKAIMGVFPVIAALPRIRRWFQVAEEELVRRRPKALLLVDYPGFNLRLAAVAQRLSIPVIYYISPQVWAWNRKRVNKIAARVDLMLVILPFEVDAYQGLDIDVRYVGHPLMDRLAEDTVEAASVEALASSRPTVALFPGSRRHVVDSLLPVFAKTARELSADPDVPDCHFLVSEAHDGLINSTLANELFRGIDFQIVTGDAPAVMEAADVACTTSGTTTLELTGRGVPFVLAYRVSCIIWLLGKLLIRVPHIGLVNLVAQREVVPEHVGVRSGHKKLANDLASLITDSERRDAMRADLNEVRELLDQKGSYARTASEIANFLDSHK